MIQFAVLLLLLLIVLCVAFLLITALFLLAMAAIVVVPLWFFGRHWVKGRVRAVAHNPVERLRALYLDGKIDLWEFERRVAQLIAVERV